MFWFKQKETKEEMIIPLNGLETKLFIHHQNRNNCRVALGKKGVIIRLSNHLSKEQKIAQTKVFIEWAKKELAKKAQSRSNQMHGYTDGRVLKLFDQDITLRISETEATTAKAKLKGQEIQVSLPKFLSEIEKKETISEFITKILRKLYQSKIEHRLRSFCQEFQLGQINNVRLKNNSSNWGSCSSKGNVNVSIRLLLAPTEVVDYVLIHELCHLVHPNHSATYWKLVAKCCPSYRKSETWLKENGHLCVL